MAPRMTFHNSVKQQIEYSFWLVFDYDGTMRMSRTQPGTARGERAMSCTAIVPMALFKTPELKATITVASPEAAAEFTIDTQAAAEALRGALGVDVDVQINPQP